MLYAGAAGRPQFCAFPAGRRAAALEEYQAQNGHDDQGHDGGKGRSEDKDQHQAGQHHRAEARMIDMAALDALHDFIKAQEDHVGRRNDERYGRIEPAAHDQRFP